MATMDMCCASSLCNPFHGFLRMQIYSYLMTGLWNLNFLISQ